MVITFCFHQFLIGRLWAEILTATVQSKTVKSWRAPIFCRWQYFDVFCMAGRYNNPVQCGRESAHKSRAPTSNSTLGDCMWRDQYLLGEVGEHQIGLGEVSCCGLCRGKTVKRCFLACANILLMPRFCRCGYIVDANNLLTRIFCWCQHFFGANILLPPIFCLCLVFKDDYLLNILLMIVFCV